MPQSSEPELEDTAPAPARAGPHTPRLPDSHPAHPNPPSAEATPVAHALTGASSAPAGPPSLPGATSGEVLPFQSWERYKILAFLGAGGMGTVYKARDPKLHRYVAIKFLRASHADLQNSRERRHFEREARAQAALEHPHICKM